jgi:O-acetyl-ADP-ribose deacetylase (regulator of RNase III)
MNSALKPLPLAYAAFILVIFLGYGALVRKGVIAGRAILWAGVPLALLAMAASVIDMLPMLRAGVPPILVLFNAGMMALLTAFCVFLSYRSQRIDDVATYALGDTKIIVRICTPIRIPEADALLLPANTALRLTEGVGPLIGSAAGPALAAELAALGPVGMGKIVATGAGKLAAGRIFHAAVSDPGRPVDAARLRKGMEAAAQQARKARAESLAVPVGVLRGLAFPQAAEAIVGGVLRQRKAFAEIVIIAFEPRFAGILTEIVQAAVLAEEKLAVSTR